MQPMRTSAIHLAERFIGDRTGLVLKKYAVFGQHRESSKAAFSIVTMRRLKVGLT